ncbi:hypothetical protein VTJ83DRAFT_1269 [Remersonia thermophila]|uniref:PH domain-containing protein n=1 Tax=Remersonia thermophila TaxID=72144 RepID=A0ABR4DNK5_9PEZI
MSDGQARKLLRKHAWRFLKEKGISTNSASILYTRNGRKQEREVYPGLSPEDAAVLVKVRKMAYRYDQMFSFCGIRFGITTLIGLVPVLGDFFEVLLCWRLIRVARKVAGGLPSWMACLMVLNLLLDLLIGFVPVAGDFADLLYRANLRNAWMFEAYMRAKSEAIQNGGFVTNPDDPENRDKWVSIRGMAGEGARMLVGPGPDHQAPRQTPAPPPSVYNQAAPPNRYPGSGPQPGLQSQRMQTGGPAGLQQQRNGGGKGQKPRR